MNAPLVTAPNSAVHIVDWRKKAKDALAAQDMTPESWRDLVAGLVEFFSEEAQEPEHAEDEQSRDPDGKFGAGGGGERIKFASVEAKPGTRSKGAPKAERKEMTPEERAEWQNLADAEMAKAEAKYGKQHKTLSEAAGESKERIGFKSAGTKKGEDDGRSIALDSARTEDIDGRMRVTQMNISKAAVNPYKGAEIPGSDALGLDPERVYYLYRDPEELAKAAASSNGVQILRKHIPVNAEDHQPWDVVGALGTDGAFADPYLTNSGTFWTADDIAGIKSGRKKQVSLGYHYTADMRPGTSPDGIPYDGVMRSICVNHVALVEDGRAGNDVCVADEAPEARDWRVVAEAVLSIGA